MCRIWKNSRLRKHRKDTVNNRVTERQRTERPSRVPTTSGLKASGRSERSSSVRVSRLHNPTHILHSAFCGAMPIAQTMPMPGQHDDGTRERKPSICLLGRIRRRQRDADAGNDDADTTGDVMPTHRHDEKGNLEKAFTCGIHHNVYVAPAWNAFRTHVCRQISLSLFAISIAHCWRETVNILTWRLRDTYTIVYTHT